MSLEFAQSHSDAVPIRLVNAEDWAQVAETLGKAHRGWAEVQNFKGKLGSILCLPNGDGSLGEVLVGWGNAKARRRGRHHLAKAVALLPDADYAVDLSGLSAEDRDDAALSVLLAQYTFAQYAKQTVPPARIAAPEGVDAETIGIIANGVALSRDLINTPAADMGPQALEEVTRRLALEHDATFSAKRGDTLLVENLPMIHAVGRAADSEPRLLDLVWGRADAPLVTLVGKGVCFDTGGLNLKPAGSMGLMKKDMGGAATTLGLAHMLMSAKVDIRLRVLIPAVENAVSGNAMRPGDILTARNGKTVEINNTDAEGRLVLADALSLADDEEPGLIVSLATLTGAARVALGPDLPPFYTDDDALAGEIAAASQRVRDPVWRMPLWPPYERMIEPGIADLDNAPSGGMAGSITAALFLNRFVTQTPFVHFDIYGWTPAALPGRPKGGECQAARALFSVLDARYGRV